MNPNAPIGVFDSGVGGLTVVAALQRLLPRESILYLGDTARLPYGTKSPSTVLAYSRRIVDFLVDRGVKAVVVACNTASAVTVGALQPPVPLWGVLQPGAARAAALTRGRVGVIATESTVKSDAYGRELKRLRPDVEVISRACPLFVPLVEEGWHDDPVAREVARRYLEPLRAEEVDTLVLGCTHYPLLTGMISLVVGEGVTLVSSAEETAKDVYRVLVRDGLERDPSAGPPKHRFLATGDAAPFAKVGRRFLGPEMGQVASMEERLCS